jgi:hypothetical protein
VEITCRVYRPRRPRESPLFRLVEQHLEDTAAYLVRNLSLRKLIYLDGRQAVL